MGSEKWTRAEPMARMLWAEASTPRPRRAKLAEALACVTDVSWLEGRRILRTTPSGLDVSARTHSGYDRTVRWAIRDPAEAWEVLATNGVIPEDWVGDTRRRFDGFCPECQLRSHAGPGCAWCFGHGEQGPHPATVAACVALASDVEGVLAAEAAMREAVARMRAEDGPTWRREDHRDARPDRMTWWVGPWRGPGTHANVWHPPVESVRAVAALGYEWDGVIESDIVLVAPPLEAP